MESLAGNLERPWALAILPGDEGLLITERTGDLRHLRGGVLRGVPGIPEVAVVGQGGLLDIVLSPEFGSDRLIYLSFAEAGSGGYGTAVARGRLRSEASGALRLTDTEVIFRALPRSGGGRHFGSRLAFDDEGYLYVTLGDRGAMNRAQDPFDPYGGLLRLNPDGTVPRDNPFAPGGERPGEGAPELWSWGHRNAQGLMRHPITGDLWLHEHGPKGGDEVNIVEKGANYGWPRTSFGIDYDGSVITDDASLPGITDPVIHWTPSIAPSGMAYYDGAAFPNWRGDVFVGALAGRHLRRLELSGNTVVDQEVLLDGRLGRIRDVRVGDDGAIYLLTDADRGGLYRLSPAED